MISTPFFDGLLLTGDQLGSKKEFIFAKKKPDNNLDRAITDSVTKGTLMILSRFSFKKIKCDTLNYQIRKPD